VHTHPKPTAQAARGSACQPPDRSDSLVTEVGTGLSATAGSERSRRATPSRVLGAGALVAVSPGHLQPRGSASSKSHRHRQCCFLARPTAARVPDRVRRRFPTQNGRAGPRVLRVRIGRRSCPRWQPSRLHGHAVRAGVGRRPRGPCPWPGTAGRGPCGQLRQAPRRSQRRWADHCCRGQPPGRGRRCDLVEGLGPWVLICRDRTLGAVIRDLRPEVLRAPPLVADGPALVGFAVGWQLFHRAAAALRTRGAEGWLSVATTASS